MDMLLASAGSANLPVAVASGAFIALLLGLFGGGGSVLATPLLIYAVGLTDPHVAIGTGAAAVALNAAGNLAVQARAGTVKWPCALSFAAAGLVGALVGAALAQRLDGQSLLTAFAFAMFAVGAAMLRPAGAAGNADVRLDLGITLKLLPAGFVVGLLAGFFGIGGGFLIVPGLMAAAGMTMANAAASSLVSVLVFGVATASTYAAAGRIDGPVLIAMAAGGIVGVAAARWLAPRLAARAALARRLFALMVIATSLYVGWRSLG
ncbi:sulfite exporter TauE/SafE family protein [Sandarakinorhabdus sp.]|uniref:sulfite exporter TauE/SafE family protein n=1 Tax=Sandarakinorhabdus sp. TaxID=1916663 RepID=UPI00333F99B4